MVVIWDMISLWPIQDDLNIPKCLVRMVSNYFYRKYDCKHGTSGATNPHINNEIPLIWPAKSTIYSNTNKRTINDEH